MLVICYDTRMDLVSANKAFWQTYEAGTTPHVATAPDDTVYARLEPGTIALDIGCGDGALAEELANRNLQVYGIDINQNAITAAHERRTDVHYSVGDICEGTDFATESIGFATLRYILTSVHRPAWPAFTDEMERIMAPGSYVWLAEPLMNEAYASRSALAEPLTGEPQTLYVFKDRDLADKVRTPEALQEAIDTDKISRICRLYSDMELLSLFPGFELVDQALHEDTSPSGYPLATTVMLLQKRP
jgi:ubiquinone/menaquinone biosynthesis C-methylase UbiE